MHVCDRPVRRKGKYDATAYDARAIFLVLVWRPRTRAFSLGIGLLHLRSLLRHSIVIVWHRRALRQF